jgi:hypothetical protein
MKRVIFVALLAFLVSQFRSGYPIARAADPLPATGQTLCYDTPFPDPSGPDVDSVEVACGSSECPGQDGLDQAGCLNDANRFILHLGSNGVLDDPDMPVDDTVTDRCTGLMWQVYTADVDGDGMFERGNGSNASDDRALWCEALAYCEDLTFAGFSDWRLPNVYEAESLFEHGRVLPPPQTPEEPAIHPFFHVVTRDRSYLPYWTSTHVTRKAESLTVPAVVDGGTGYQVNDLLDVVGGVLSGDGSGIVATFTVAEVDDGVAGGPGAVTYTYHGVQGNPGNYSETPANPATTSSRRAIPGAPGEFEPGGSGAILNVDYNAPRIAYFANYYRGSINVWDGVVHDVRNGVWVRAVRSVSAAAGGGAGGDGAERGGGAGPICAVDNGNANGDSSIDLSDAVYSLAWLFQGGPQPVPFCITPGPKEVGCAAENGNTNGDAARDLSDVIYSLAWLFQGGPQPVPICQGVVPDIETDCDSGNCCANGIDDDQDGDTDCDDADCAGGPACFEANCGDNVDNDGDGDTDCDDADCAVTLDCLGSTGVLPDTSQTACQDENGVVIDCASVSACNGLQDSLTDNGCDAAARFVDNMDGTVSDTCTGLLWLKAFKDATVIGQPLWCTTLELVEQFNDDEFGGFDDWRLPNIRELQSIMDYSRARPAMDIDLWFVDGIVGNFARACLWSSTSLDPQPDFALVMSLAHGTTAGVQKDVAPRIPGGWTPISVRTP